MKKIRIIIFLGRDRFFCLGHAGSCLYLNRINWWVNWNNLGAIYEREKNYPKAAEYYQKSIDNGQYYLAYENLLNLNAFIQEKNNQK